MTILWESSSVLGFGIRATDGSIGTLEDLLFEDTDWAMRWAVVDTGSWLPGRRVLLPPSSFGPVDAVAREFPVDLTRERVKDAPGLDSDAPVSRQLESQIFGYYGWTPYWAPGYPIGPGAVGGLAAPVPPAGVAEPTVMRADEQAPGQLEGDPHLRSVREVTGYYVEATDGEIGHVEDFMVDENGWAIRYLLVDTKNWWPGKIVLISPAWLRDISWGDRKVFVDVSREKVKSSPEYDPAASLGRGYEERLYDHYGYPPYWA